jgi:hypothetical protein
MTKNLEGCQILLPNRPLISFRVRTQVQLLALIAGFSLAATQTGATEENETVVAARMELTSFTRLFPTMIRTMQKFLYFQPRLPSRKSSWIHSRPSAGIPGISPQIRTGWRTRYATFTRLDTWSFIGGSRVWTSIRSRISQVGLGQA